MFYRLNCLVVCIGACRALDYTNKNDWSSQRACGQYADGFGRALGLESGFVGDEQFSSSSFVRTKEPFNARLNYKSSMYDEK